MGTLKRYAAKRDRIESEIVKALVAAGATVQPLSARGVPDLLVGFRGECFLLETKAKGGTLTDDQVKWHAWWRGQVAVVRTIEEALRAIGALD